MLDELVVRLLKRDRLALARLLSLAGRPGQAERIRSALPAPADNAKDGAKVVAVTGNSGVGKSSLIARLIEFLREHQQSVAVLACDPQSSLTGGALLGDRVRMPSRPDDPDVFIRSLAAPSGHQALADHLDVMVRLLDTFGFDVVILETVGAGQGDTAVRDAADAVVLLLQPQIGDELQWEKAGILEVADIVVIHKSDLPGAEHVEAQVRELLNLPGCREVPVLRASAARQEGIAELWQQIQSLHAPAPGAHRNGQALLRLAQERLAERFTQQGESVREIVARWHNRELDESQATEELIQTLLQRES